MSDPVLFCAIVYANFVSFMGYHSDLTAYARDIESLDYLVEEAADIADALALCGGHEREIVLIAKLGRQAADQAHALEDRAQHDGTPLRNY